MTITLNKPKAGTQNWDVPVNENWEMIEKELNAKIQLVSAAPAAPVAGVLYCIPEKSDAVIS